LGLRALAHDCNGSAEPRGELDAVTRLHADRDAHLAELLLVEGQEVVDVVVAVLVALRPVPVRREVRAARDR
jgi:hypothetical protein